MNAMASDLRIAATLQRSNFQLDVKLCLPGRGVTVVNGASGSGKTTLLRVLAGLEPQARGRLEVQGQVWQDDATGTFLPTYRRALGFVFQEASLFEHLNVEANLRFGFDRTPPAQRHTDWPQVLQLLELLGIANLRQRGTHQLSGGERQRVAIARALAASPRVLLMDEPLASLDAQRKAEILPWLEQLHAHLDIPVLYVTHSNEELARLADHVVILNEGRVLASGPAEVLLTQLDLPLAHEDNAAAIVNTRVSDEAVHAHFIALEFEGGQLLVPQTKVPGPAPHTRVRVRIQARDVSLSLQRPENTSVLNILPATVVDLTPAGPGQVLVGLEAGIAAQGVRLLSRISLLSADRLHIKPGLMVYAQIKGVAMVA